MCRFFNVSRIGYYGYVSRMEITARDLPLAEKNCECQKECGKTYGYRRVHNFNAERPNQKWVTDISYIYTKQGVLYLSVIRDLFDNSIVAYKTGTEQNINLVLSIIRDAKKKEKVTT